MGRATKTELARTTEGVLKIRPHSMTPGRDSNDCPKTRLLQSQRGETILNIDIELVRLFKIDVG